MVLTGIDTDPRLGFAYLVVDADAVSAIKEPEQKILRQFGTVKRHFFRPANLV